MQIKMGTPLKPMRLLLSPNFITPLSPKLNHNGIQINRHGKNVVKRLDFSPAKSAKIEAESAIKINVIDTEKTFATKISHSLLMNTPNKLSILKFGFKSFKGLNILGRGTFGTVVKGKYKGEDVAVKVLKTKSASKESNALKLNHQNVIKIIDIIKNDIHSIIIMEYLDNARHLQIKLDDEHFQLDPDKVFKISTDICNGVKHCHDNKVMHLDLKPCNILICQDGSSKICDFGNSVFSGSLQEHYIHEGTVIYTAPEILLGSTPTFACDIYSLGIIFWQLRSRELPYQHLENNDVVIYKVVKHGLRPSSKKDGVEDKFSALYNLCWHTNAKLRPTIRSVIDMLRDL